MSIIYGKSLAVKVGSTVESTVDGWEIDHQGNLVPYVSGNTDGGTGREGGNKDWTGLYRKYGAIPEAFPGDSFAGIFSTEGTLGYYGTARCLRVVWDWDVDAGGYIESRVSFGANGVLTRGAAVAVDASFPAPVNVKGLSLKLDGTQQTNVRRMRMVAQIKPRKYCVAESDGQYFRTDGELDMLAMWQVLEDDPTAFPELHATHVVQIMTASTPTYWTITWMRIEAVEPFGVDRRKTDVPVGATIIASFDCSSSTSLGSVVSPAGVTKWPV